MTYSSEDRLIDELVSIRKKNKMSQTELANKIGVKQQSVSRIERKETGVSLGLFLSMADALGYKLEIVKKR